MMTKRGRRWLRRGVLTTILVLVLLAAVATWFHSESIESRLLAISPVAPALDIEIIGSGGDTITLARTDASAREGVWGLEWEGGYAVVGEIVTESPETVTRHLSTIDGEIVTGAPAAIDPFAARSDPADVGVDYQDVVFDGPLGEYPAWLTAGSDDTWVVFVHGKDTNRREALRILPTMAALGFPTFDITYRGDPEAPPYEGRHDLGRTEWEDLEAAVLHALGSGAHDVVIVGYGMGAAVASQFLHLSPWADRVQGVIFDAPLLDPGRVVDAEAERRNIPGFMTVLAKTLAEARFGLKWDLVDQIERAGRFDVPILVLHGEDDERIPVEGSRLLAEARPDLVILATFPGAGDAWNADPARYEDVVGAFLADQALGSSDLDRVVPEG